jgi:hypothetical protein
LTSKVEFVELVITSSLWSGEFAGGERNGEIVVRKERNLNQ